MAQILIYDDKEMHVFEVINLNPKPASVCALECSTIGDAYYRSIFPESTYEVEITIGEIKAELDPTTMKRIARYNLKRDLEELNHQIKNAEDKLKNLNEQVEVKEEKMDFMKELLRMIWDDPCFDQDNYLPDE